VNYELGTGNKLASWTATSTNNFVSLRVLRVEGHSSEAIGTDDRWGQLYVSNSVAVVPDINGTNFSIDAFTVGLGTQTVVAAIRDQAGNVGYATNEFFLSVVTNAQYRYSAAGCLTNVSYSGTEYSDTKALEWNSQYQLVSVSSVSSVVQYAYDVLGRRASRTEGTNTQFYVYDGDQVIADVDASGEVLRTYVWGSGIDNLLSMTVYTNGTTNTYYALKDHLNSVHAFVNESGSVVESYEYDAWGRTTILDANDDQLKESAIGTRYMWQGREFDASTEFYHFRARSYDPVSARWLSKDPIGISGGLNQYVFCANNPVNFIDPLGGCPEEAGVFKYLAPIAATKAADIFLKALDAISSFGNGTPTPPGPPLSPIAPKVVPPLPGPTYPKIPPKFIGPNGGAPLIKTPIIIFVPPGWWEQMQKNLNAPMA
jgi:RHS repeat-associated protein